VKPGLRCFAKDPSICPGMARAEAKSRSRFCECRDSKGCTEAPIPHPQPDSRLVRVVRLMDVFSAGNSCREFVPECQRCMELKENAGKHAGKPREANRRRKTTKTWSDLYPPMASRHHQGCCRGGQRRRTWTGRAEKHLCPGTLCPASDNV